MSVVPVEAVSCEGENENEDGMHNTLSVRLEVVLVLFRFARSARLLVLLVCSLPSPFLLSALLSSSTSLCERRENQREKKRNKDTKDTFLNRQITKK